MQNKHLRSALNPRTIFFFFGLESEPKIVQRNLTKNCKIRTCGLCLDYDNVCEYKSADRDWHKDIKETTIWKF